jgi:hypothetical protein
MPSLSIVEKMNGFRIKYESKSFSLDCSRQRTRSYGAGTGAYVYSFKLTPGIVYFHYFCAVFSFFGLLSNKNAVFSLFLCCIFILRIIVQ